MASALPPATLAALALLVTGSRSSRLGPVLVQPILLRALAASASKELSCSAAKVEQIMAFLLSARDDLAMRIRRRDAAGLKIFKDAKSELHWIKEVRKRTNVDRYSPSKTRRTSQEKEKLAEVVDLPRQKQSTPAKVTRKRDYMPHTEKEKMFANYWKTVSPALILPKLLQR